MSASLFCPSRAVVTGFCAAHTRLGASCGAWLEYSSLDSPDLRGLFDLGNPCAEYSGIAAGRWWERFFACGIIRALQTAGLWRDEKLSVAPERVGICFSSSKGRPAQWETVGETGASVFENSCDWALREIAIQTGATGKRICPVAACAGGSHAVAIGAQWIEDGLADVVICGAIEAELASLVLAGYKQLGALSHKKIMRPFDESRDGFVPAPGAGCLILENAEMAQRRGAGVLGCVAGASLMCDATSLTGLEPSGQPIQKAIENAMRKQSTPRIDYVNAHGTATRMNDAIEARAIAGVLGGQVPVSSTKSLTGHLLGAAGAVEAIFCILAMQQNFAPPNFNLQTLDKSCELDIVGKAGRETSIEIAMSLSYGFGGHIGVILLEKN